ncbi:MAG: STAS domain-containing protein [Chlamydiota bacterium]
MNIQIDVEEVENKYILRIQGRIDTMTTPILEKRIEELVKQNHWDLLADFTDVEYLSSAGLRVLLSSTKKARAHQGHFVLFSIDEDVLEIIKMAGFERVLTICTSEKDALQSCA